MKSIVVIPTYNEKANIEPLLKEILTLVPDIHVLVVDDSSPDGTAELVHQLQSSDSRIHLMVRKSARGRGLAGIAGFLYAIENNFDYIIEMDADFSHSPHDIPRFLAEIKIFDIVIGSRNIPGGKILNRPLIRDVISCLANLYIRLVLRLPIYDCSSGFRCFRKEVLASIHLEEMVSVGPSILEEILYACQQRRYKFKEIPITFHDRKEGQSKLTLEKILNTFYVITLIPFKGKSVEKPSKSRKKIALER